MEARTTPYQIDEALVLTVGSLTITIATGPDWAQAEGADELLAERALFDKVRFCEGVE